MCWRNTLVAGRVQEMILGAMARTSVLDVGFRDVWKRNWEVGINSHGGEKDRISNDIEEKRTKQTLTKPNSKITFPAHKYPLRVFIIDLGATILPFRLFHRLRPPCLHRHGFRIRPGLEHKPNNMLRCTRSPKARRSLLHRSGNWW